MSLSKLITPFFVLGVVVIARCAPHLANFSPLIGLLLLAPIALEQRYRFVYCLVALLLSDALLALIDHQAWLGAWSFWTYSGFAAVYLMGQYWPKLGGQWASSLFAGMSASLGFWVWTNIGVWISSGIYVHTLSGLTDCFVAAIPFLSRSVLGTLVVVSGYLFYKSLSRRVYQSA